MKSNRFITILLILGLVAVGLLFFFQFETFSFDKRLGELESQVQKVDTKQLMEEIDNGQVTGDEEGSDDAIAIYTYPGVLKNPFRLPEDLFQYLLAQNEDAAEQAVQVTTDSVEPYKFEGIPASAVESLFGSMLEAFYPVYQQESELTGTRPVLKGVGYHQKKYAILQLGSVHYVVSEGEMAGDYRVVKIADRELLLLKDNHIYKIKMGGEQS